jgi:hypothetical protein
MIRLQYIPVASKFFFYLIYYVIFSHLLSLKFHEVQIVHFRHSILFMLCILQLVNMFVNFNPFSILVISPDSS